MTNKFKYAQDQAVKFDLGFGMTGNGIIVGSSIDPNPLIGRSYIVRVEKMDNDEYAIPNALYPYNTISVFESQIKE